MRRNPSAVSWISSRQMSESKSGGSLRARCRRSFVSGWLPPWRRHDAGARDHDQHGYREKLIEENRLDKLQAAIETGTEDGMINFNQALFQLVKDGKVTEKEALAKATNPQALEMNFKGIFLDEGKRILT